MSLRGFWFERRREMRPRNLKPMLPDESAGHEIRRMVSRPHRFTMWVPHIALLALRPLTTLVIALLIGAPLLIVSPHWAMAPICLWVPLLAARLDWRLMDRLALPPGGILLVPSAVGCGVGIPMYIVGQGISYSPVHFLIQVLYVVTALTFLLGYRFGRGSLRGQVFPPNVEPALRSSGIGVTGVGYLLLFFDVIRLFIEWRTGAMDRGYRGEVVLNANIGIWTYLDVMGRWVQIWSFFLPFLWRRGSLLERVLLTGVVLFELAVILASGSRGILLYPVIFAACGLYFFIDRPTFRPERWLPVAIVLAGVFIYTADLFRSSVEFQESNLANLGQRFAAARNITGAARERGDFQVTTGKALLGVSDELIYTMTPSEIPFAGGGDIFRALLWSWLPHKLAPSKPLLVDGNEIVVNYTGQRFERSSNAISLTADLYRRWGWWAIVPGWFFVGFVFGCFIRTVMHILLFRNLVLGVVLMVIVFGMLQLGFFNTVLTTWWVWTYDLPKNIIPLVLITFMLNAKVQRGLLAAAIIAPLPPRQR